MTTTITFPHGWETVCTLRINCRSTSVVGTTSASCATLTKQCLFPPGSVVQEKVDAPKVAWDHAKPLGSIDDVNHWMANKAMFNFSAKPMPDIGPPSVELWREFAAEKVDLHSRIPEQATGRVAPVLRHSGTTDHPAAHQGKQLSKGEERAGRPSGGNLSQHH
jgi:hypothetical protein